MARHSPIPARFTRRLVVAASLALAAALAAGCGGAASAAKAPAEAAAPRARDAALIAQDLCGGKIGVIVHGDRVRGHALAGKIGALEFWKPVLEGTGIDPVKDLDRAFLTAPSSKEPGVAVAEHGLSDERVRAAIEKLIARSDPPGKWIDDLGVPAARVRVRGQPAVVAMPREGILVVVPEALAAGVKRFAATGGLPEPVGPEAALANAVDPHTTLRAPRAPAVPETVRQASATVVLTADGGADVQFDGLSASEDQATADAEAMTRSVEAATTVKIAFVQVRFFEPVLFKAAGDHVKAKVHLGPAEIDRLLGLVQALTHG